jgi:type I site-specific restriction-modification system R (restriction) subunit
MTSDLHAATLKIYREILEQLEEIKDLYTDSASEREELEADDEREAQQDVVDTIIEEAAERGLDEEDTARVFKAVAIISKKAMES